jgi:hypothetical protein
MKTLFTTLVTLFSFLSLHTIDDNNTEDEKKDYFDFIYAYNYVYKHTKSKKRSKTIAKYFITYTRQYGLIEHRKSLLRQTRNESWFKKAQVGDNGQSLGLNQIKVKYVTNKSIPGNVWELDNGKLGKKIDSLINKGIRPPYEKYLLQIKYNMELRCIIMKNYLVRFNCIEVSYLAYGCGTSSDTFQAKKNDAYIDHWYVRGIMDEKEDKNIIKKYNGKGGKA